MIEGSYIETNEKYKRGVAVDEYNGTYSLAAVETGKDGKQYLVWCFPQKFKDGQKVAADKAVPVKIGLGNREEAIARLKLLLGALEADLF